MVANRCSAHGSAAVLRGSRTSVSIRSLNEYLIGVRTQCLNDCTVLSDTMGDTRLELMVRADAVHVCRAACAQSDLFENT